VFIVDLLIELITLVMIFTYMYFGVSTTCVFVFEDSHARTTPDNGTTGARALVHVVEAIQKGGETARTMLARLNT